MQTVKKARQVKSIDYYLNLLLDQLTLYSELLSNSKNKTDKTYYQGYVDCLKELLTLLNTNS